MDREQLEKGLTEHLRILDEKLKEYDSIRAQQLKARKALAAFQGVSQTSRGNLTEKAYLIVQSSPDGISGGEVAERVGCNKSAITYHLNRLLMRGQIRKRGNAAETRWFPLEEAPVIIEKAKKNRR